MSFEAFMFVIFNVGGFWVMMPCSVVVGYQHFRGSCCLHLQREPTTTLHNVTSQKTLT